MINLDKLTAAKLKIAARVFDSLATYCTLRERSLTLKEKGMYNESEHVERKLCEMYLILPQWAQWEGFTRQIRRKKSFTIGEN